MNLPHAPWWRGAVIYQVYPRSFCDSNADGIGDLPGITSKLDYIRDLGVDGLWISPFFESPQDDFGYDVSDHCSVDPIFGNLDDFDELLSAAHDRGLKVIVDQVYSHTSDRHRWFEESRQGMQSDRSDWYIWADAKEEGSPPNNWQSVFGGPAWTWDARRRQYYMHNYLSSQPDLNLHHPPVQDALLNIAAFWLDRGVDGLRLDAINYGFHDPALRDNPPAPAGIRGDARPWLMQLKQFNTNHEAMPGFLERLGSLCKSYGDVMTVAEVGGNDPLPVMQQYTCGNDRLSTAYGFDFLSAPSPDAGHIQTSLSAWSNEADSGWPSWAFSNHDAPRVVSRWDIGIEENDRAVLFMLLLICLRGTAFVYQGEELGLTQANVPFEQLKDPEAIANWPHTLGRDGTRTPMPWDTERSHAGFSEVEPWLPVATIHRESAVSAQRDDADSVLNRVRELLALRRSTLALRTGSNEFIDAPPGTLVFRRHAESQSVLCVFNLGAGTVEWQPSERFGEILAEVRLGADLTRLQPFSGFVALL